LAVCIAAGGNLWVQLLGIAAVGVFVFGFSWLTWKALQLGIGVRVSPSVEEIGQDAMELGIEAYPEFVLMPDPDDVGGLRNSSGEP
jgi:Amt family ammonium transporter